MYGKRWTDNDTLRFINKLRNREYPPEIQRLEKNVNWKGLEELETEIKKRKLQKKELRNRPPNA